MRRGTSNIVSLSLLTASVAIAAPLITDLVARAANRPASARGSRRRLEGIRNGSLPDDGLNEFYIDSPGALLP